MEKELIEKWLEKAGDKSGVHGVEIVKNLDEGAARIMLDISNVFGKPVIITREWESEMYRSAAKILNDDNWFVECAFKSGGIFGGSENYLIFLRHVAFENVQIEASFGRDRENDENLRIAVTAYELVKKDKKNITGKRLEKKLGFSLDDKKKQVGNFLYHFFTKTHKDRVRILLEGAKINILIGD